jgi:hypothetical protein
MAGDPAAVRDLFAGLLPDFQRMLAAAQPSTLIVRRNVARFTGEAGDPAAAREQVHGPGHPNTLIPRTLRAVVAA